MSEPSRDELLSWMHADEERGVKEAVEHFWPELRGQTTRDPEFGRCYRRIYSYVRKERKDRRPSPEQPHRRKSRAAQPPTLVSLPTPQPDLTEASKVERIKAQIRESEAHTAWLQSINSGQALVSNKRHVLTLYEALEAAQAERAEWDPYDLEQVVDAMIALPDLLWDHPRVIARFLELHAGDS